MARQEVILDDDPYDVYVAQSTLPDAGKGLFALRKFRENELIVPYLGEELTPSQVERRYPKGDAKYLFCPTEGRCIDAKDPAKSNLGRYANSLPMSKANAKLTVRGNITAKKDIYPGQEIFVNRLFVYAST